VFWLNCASAARLFFDLDATARMLGLHDEDAPAVDLTLARWVVVCEDASDASVVAMLGFSMEHGAILATSTPTLWDGVDWMDSVEVDRLDRGPLACTIASAYCAEFNVSVDGFVELLVSVDGFVELLVEAENKRKRELHREMEERGKTGMVERGKTGVLVNPSDAWKTKSEAASEAVIRCVLNNLAKTDPGVIEFLFLFQNTQRFDVIRCVLNNLAKTDPGVIEFLFLFACLHPVGIPRTLFLPDEATTARVVTLTKCTVLKAGAAECFDVNIAFQTALRDMAGSLEPYLREATELLVKGMFMRPPPTGPPRGEKPAETRTVVEEKGGGFAFGSKAALKAEADAKVAKEKKDREEGVWVVRPGREAWVVHVLEIESHGGNPGWRLLEVAAEHF
ncbi:hypothetical protein T484DRAFT_1833595, partial [Baffinella frigidus]